MQSKKNKQSSGSLEFQGKDRKKNNTVFTDEELKMLVNNDNYAFIKQLKQVFMWVIIAIILFLTFCILTNMYDLRMFFVDKLKENLTAIIFFVLALFGMKSK